MRRFPADDHAPRLEPLPLFAWPETPAVPEVEQKVLPFSGTIQGRYEAWKKTEDGIRVMEAISVRAFALAAQGEQRIGSKRLVEMVRAALHLEINNDYTALIARELNQYPALRGKIELRQRKAV